MKFSAPACVAVVFACAGAASVYAQNTNAASAVPPPAAETPGDTGYSEGKLRAIGNWFRQDWTHGWDRDSSWRVMFAPYTYHFSRDPDHRYVVLAGVERQRSDGFVAGGTVFRNSFGQPSTYWYVGQRFDRVGGVDALFTQVTGGLMYGYRVPYEDKVPLNFHGLSPGLVPSVGWQFSRALSAQIDFLGNSALMFQLSAGF